MPTQPNEKEWGTQVWVKRFKNLLDDSSILNIPKIKWIIFHPEETALIPNEQAKKINKRINPRYLYKINEINHSSQYEIASSKRIKLFELNLQRSQT